MNKTLVVDDYKGYCFELKMQEAWITQIIVLSYWVVVTKDGAVQETTERYSNSGLAYADARGWVDTEGGRKEHGHQFTCENKKS